MVVYTYDGTFEGLLTAIYEAFYQKSKPHRIIAKDNLQLGFLDQYVHITTNFEKSRKVYDSIAGKISRDTLEKAYQVYLSNDAEAGTIIFEYLRLGWKMGGRVNSHLSDDRVLRVHKICQRVCLENHRFLGFVRFKRLKGGVYYAPIEPDNNIVELLAPHFAERLSDQKWVIHDVKRGLAAVFNGEGWIITDLTLDRLPEQEESESRYLELWKEFFREIAIVNRTNFQLQKRLMPVRYWKYIPEKW